MEYELGHHSLKDIIVHGFRFYKSSFPKLILVPLVALPAALIWGSILILLILVLGHSRAEGPFENVKVVMSFFLIVFSTAAVFLLPGIALAVSVIVQMISDKVTGNYVGIGRVLRSAIRRFMAVYSVMLICYGLWVLMAIAIAVLQIADSALDIWPIRVAALIIPPTAFVFGIYLTVLLVFAPVVANLESVGPIRSIKRSSSLVAGNWWSTFGRMVALFALMFAIGLALVPLGIILPVVGWVLGTMVFVPLITTYYTLMYFEAKQPYDGTDTLHTTLVGAK